MPSHTRSMTHPGTFCALTQAMVGPAQCRTNLGPIQRRNLTAFGPYMSTSSWNRTLTSFRSNSSASADSATGFANTPAAITITRRENNRTARDTWETLLWNSTSYLSFSLVFRLRDASRQWSRFDIQSTFYMHKTPAWPVTSCCLPFVHSVSKIPIFYWYSRNQFYANKCTCNLKSQSTALWISNLPGNTSSRSRL